MTSKFTHGGILDSNINIFIVCLGEFISFSGDLQIWALQTKIGNRNMIFRINGLNKEENQWININTAAKNEEQNGIWSSYKKINCFSNLLYIHLYFISLHVYKWYAVTELAMAYK